MACQDLGPARNWEGFAGSQSPAATALSHRSHARLQRNDPPGPRMSGFSPSCTILPSAIAGSDHTGRCPIALCECAESKVRWGSRVGSTSTLCRPVAVMEGTACDRAAGDGLGRWVAFWVCLYAQGRRQAFPRPALTMRLDAMLASVQSKSSAAWRFLGGTKVAQVAIALYSTPLAAIRGWSV